MLANEYQVAAMRTATSNERANTPEQRLLNAALGLVGESGEIADGMTTDSPFVNNVLSLSAHVGMLADMVKKELFHGHDFDYEEMRNTLATLKSVIASAEMNLDRYNDSGAPVFVVSQPDKEHLEKEAGDIAWYVALVATAINVPLAQVFRTNIAKLQKRYKNGFSAEASRNRSE